mmetsp:Transcript_29459/g.74011  ORF Transcript_29459/g.74011 Transcript_29459/m.74011 type:complete len:107 (-) Transcript_29459:568-888(-)
MVLRRCATITQVRFREISFIEPRISRSVFVSSDDVASSARKIGGRFSRHLAIATRCFSPPDSRTPRSPTTVAYPSGRRMIVSCTCAIRAACSTSNTVASGRPYAML